MGSEQTDHLSSAGSVVKSLQTTGCMWAGSLSLKDLRSSYVKRSKINVLLKSSALSRHFGILWQGMLMMRV